MNTNTPMYTPSSGMEGRRWKADGSDITFECVKGGSTPVFRMDYGNARITQDVTPTFMDVKMCGRGVRIDVEGMGVRVKNGEVVSNSPKIKCSFSLYGDGTASA